MATIKLQPSGKVVIKDGKVSCGCCAQGGGCTEDCVMYSSKLLQYGVIVEQDLPDALTIYGVSNPRNGTSYGNTTDGVIYEDGFWLIYKSGKLFQKLICLINPSIGIVDQFANSYSVNTPFGSYTPVRNSLCVWVEGVYADDNYIAVISYQYTFRTWVAHIINQNGTEVFGEKIGFQNSPVGSYYDHNYGINFTVS